MGTSEFSDSDTIQATLCMTSKNDATNTATSIPLWHKEIATFICVGEIMPPNARANDSGVRLIDGGREPEGFSRYE